MVPDDGTPVLTRAARGYRTTLLAQGIRVACKGVSVVVLARLVSPAEHGIFAMAASVTLVLVLFRDFGLGTAALQAPQLSEEQKSTLWWIHVALGAALAVLALALAPAAAAFYDEPRVGPVLGAASASLLLIGLSSWPRVLLARDLRFAELNRLETQGAVAGTIAMIAAGALGAGAHAFVVFLLVSEALILGGVWRVCRWRPTARPRVASLQPLLAPGGNLTGHQLLTYFLQQLDLVLMGKWFGARALGLYARPAQLLFLPMTHVAVPVTQVLVATLARLGPGSPDFARHLRQTANLIAHLTLPVAAVCVALPHEVVRTLLGPAWPEAAPLLRWLALNAVALYLTATLYALCIATSTTRRLAAISAIALPASVAGMWLGRPYGPAGLAAGLALANLALLVPRLWWATRDTPVRLADYGRALSGPLVISAALAAGLAAGRALFPDASGSWRAAAAVAGGAAGVLASLGWPQLRRELRDAWRLRAGADSFARKAQPARATAGTSAGGDSSS